MRIRFIEGLVGGGWPGPVHDTPAVIGEAWVGSVGFVGILETMLGVHGRETSGLLRAASMIPALHQVQGFWSRSLGRDPIGVAQQLLTWRDALWMEGWRGEDGPGRLEGLGAVTEGVPPGLPDQLYAVWDALQRRRADLEVIELVEARASLPKMWQQILRQLEEQGTHIVEVGLPRVQARGDLMAARQPSFVPSGDSTLQLVRPQGLLRAADAVAAWLAAQDDDEETLIIDGCAALDEALIRYGLPCIGASDSGQHTVLQVLPLALEMLDHPTDPQRVHELLSLTVSPVPHPLRRALRKAIEAWPGMGNQQWHKAFADGLMGIADEAARVRVRERLEVLLAPGGQRDLPVSNVIERVTVLRDWMQVLAAQPENETVPWQDGRTQCNALIEVLQASKMSSMTLPQLRRMVSMMDQGGSARRRAQAGLGAIDVPEAMVGPAKRVIWWNFTREQARQATPLPFAGDERAKLRDLGVALPDLGTQMTRVATRWSRPLWLTERQLILVAPMTDGSNGALHPHPLWDEISARVAEGENLSKLVVRAPSGGQTVMMEESTKLELPRPRRTWSTNLSELERQRWSPTSLSTLFGCSFAWVLRYVAEISGQPGEEVPDGKQLQGSLAHRILELLFENGCPDHPDAAREQAQTIFDQEAPLIAATLFRPGNDVLLVATRTAVSDSAAMLTAMIEKSGWTAIAMESWQEREGLNGTVTGWADMILGPTPAIIDLKWGGGTYRQRELASGSNIQLALYAYTHASKGAAVMPACAFHIISERRILSTQADSFCGAEQVDGPGPKEVWGNIETTFKRAHDQLMAGKVVADGVVDNGAQEDDDPDLQEAPLSIEPPCSFCSFESLCGRAWQEG